MKIRLNVPYYKQRKMTCGPSCLQQVFAYYGKKVSLDEIIRVINKKKGFSLTGTSTWYLGFCTDEMGFDATVISYDANIIDPTWMRLSRKEFANKIKRRMKKEKIVFLKKRLKAMLGYVLCGGRYSFIIPSKEFLLKYLKQKTPLIIRLSSTVLYDISRRDRDTGEFNDMTGYPFGHYVVVSGYENGKFIITDPHATRGGIYKVSEDKLLFSWFFWGGEMLVIKPRK